MKVREAADSGKNAMQAHKQSLSHFHNVFTLSFAALNKRDKKNERNHVGAVGTAYSS